METCPDKCEACEIRNADPKETWWLTYNKSLKLCRRCARMIAQKLPTIAKEVCMGKQRKDATFEALLAKAIEERDTARAEVERLKAILDGDSNQTETPETRRAWRLSAVRSCDKAEAESAALREWRDRVTSALQNPGGAHYEDVPKLVGGMRAMLDRIAVVVADRFDPRSEECIADGVDSLSEDEAALREQNDDLVGACQQAYEDIDSLTDSACGCNSTPPMCTLCRLRAALARARKVPHG